jgi:hypothetical protein
LRSARGSRIVPVDPLPAAGMVDWVLMPEPVVPEVLPVVPEVLPVVPVEPVVPVVPVEPVVPVVPVAEPLGRVVVVPGV